MADAQRSKTVVRRARRGANEGAPPRPPAAPAAPAQTSQAAPPPRPADPPANEQGACPAPPPPSNARAPLSAPVLMLPERAGGTKRTLYDLSSGRGFDVDLPEMENCLCYAASHGWVIAGNCLTGECFLLDPLSRARRDLPKLALCTRTPHAALSSAPTEPGCVVAVAFAGTLVLCRPGDARWAAHRLEDYEHDAWLGDCAFCRGKLYLVCAEGRRLFVVEGAACDGSSAVRRVEMDAAQLPGQAPRRRRLGFLVASLGELLLVVAAEEKGTLSCGVFRADLEKGGWATVEGLGDRALYVGKGSSGSVAAAEARAGRVYISYPLVLVDEEGRQRAMVQGRWFWAEHVVGLGCAAMKKTPLLRQRDVCWDASYWLIPGNPASSSSSSSSPPPPEVQV